MDKIDTMDTGTVVDMDITDNEIESEESMGNRDNLDRPVDKIGKTVSINEEKLHEYKAILMKQIESEETNLAMKYFLLYTIDDKINQVQ